MKDTCNIKLTDASRSAISFIQKKLIHIGLLEPPVDGLAGPNTHKAWASFKRSISAVNLDCVCIEEIVRLQQSIDAFDARENLLVTKEQLTEIFQRTPTCKQVEDLNLCLISNNINTLPRITHFLAQTGHESGGLKWLVELSSGESYEGRADLGNTEPGDGRRYKGAGALQLTGRYNYQKFADYIRDPKVMLGCEYVAEHYPFSSAGWFWTTRNLNELCDSGAFITAITQVINGGQRGIEDRLAYYNRAKSVLSQRQSFLAQSLL